MRSESVFTNIGAVGHTLKPRSRNDYYATDPLAVRLLDKYGLLDHNVQYWETACGGGNLSVELERLGYDVTSSDKYDRGYGDVGVDFFECNDVFQGNTITNPPFSHINDWIVHSLKVTSNKVYIFGKIQIIESMNRWNKIFSKHKPVLICPFVKRISCYPDGNKPNYGSAICYAWFIWDNTVDNEDTRVKWLI